MKEQDKLPEGFSAFIDDQFDKPQKRYMVVEVDDSDGIAMSLASGLTQKTDQVITDAIDNAIGKGWSIEGLMGRLERIRCDGDTYETITIDGKPVIELHDPELTTRDDDGAVVLVAEQKYRILG